MERGSICECLGARDGRTSPTPSGCQAHSTLNHLVVSFHVLQENSMNNDLHEL